MLFNSFPFLFLFLPSVLLVALRLRGERLLRFFTFASLVFYGFAGHAWFIVPMLVTTALDFGIAPLIERSKSKAVRRGLLLISLTGNLGLLAFFKYSGLFAKTLAAAMGAKPETALGGALRVFDVVLPAGISFYTFQTLSYVVDVYRGRCPAERDFFTFASFVSFFPHLVAGPLTRHSQLIPQLRRVADEGIRPRWTGGVFLFALGLCKKTMVADRISTFINPMLVNPAELSLIAAWLAAVGYALQIYFDFSGYSDMAVGLGRLFGIELPQNFNRPYTARNPSDFWRRWHITLSLWLRDYLYIPLGGNRGSQARTDFNLMLTMVLGGLWHGAAWTFAAWGCFHGSLLIAYRLIQRPWDRLYVPVQQSLTFALVCVGWVFFRARSFAEVQHWLLGMVGRHGVGSLGPSVFGLAGLCATGLLIALRIPEASLERFSSLPAGARFALGLLTAVALSLINATSPFLYFQF